MSYHRANVQGRSRAIPCVSYRHAADSIYSPIKTIRNRRNPNYKPCNNTYFGTCPSLLSHSSELPLLPPYFLKSVWHRFCLIIKVAPDLDGYCVSPTHFRSLLGLDPFGTWKPIFSWGFGYLPQICGYGLGPKVAPSSTANYVALGRL